MIDFLAQRALCDLSRALFSHPGLVAQFVFLQSAGHGWPPPRPPHGKRSGHFGRASLHSNQRIPPKKTPTRQNWGHSSSTFTSDELLACSATSSL